MNPEDGTCWVLGLEPAYSELLHVGTDGTTLWKEDFPCSGTGSRRCWLAVNGEDGSVWVLDVPDSELVHLSEAGAELSRTHGLDGAIYLDPDGTCWASGYPEATHVGTDGTILGTVGAPYAIPEPANGTFWGAVWASNGARFGGDWNWGWDLSQKVDIRLQFLTADGSQLWQTGEILGAGCGWGYGYSDGYGASYGDGGFVDAGTGVYWSWSDAGDFVGVIGNGQEYGRYPAFASFWDNVALNPADGSLYFVSGSKAALLRVSRDGTQQQVAFSFTPDPQCCKPCAIIVSPADGSFWADPECH